MENNTKLISVIVPAFNAESTLKRCIESIQAQTYCNFELIIINDGSIDQTAKIIDEYSKKDQRVIGIHKRNGGVSSARNTALDIAKGEYVIFIDSDDTINCTHLDEFMKYDSDCIIGGLNIIHNGSSHTEMPETIENISKSNFGILIDKYSGATFFRGACMKAYRRSIIENYKLKVDERLHWGEDYLFTLNFLSYCESVSTITTASYNYFYPTQTGKYRVDETEYRIGLKLALDVLTKFGNCKKAEEIAKHYYYDVFMTYISQQPFRDRIKNYIKAIYNRSVQLPYGPIKRFKSHLELLRVTLISK